MKNILQDVRYAIRVLRKQPAFSVTGALVLALGIGGSTAIFSLVNALFLKPLLISHPEQIVGVYSRDTQKPDTYRAFSYPNYADLRAQDRVFSGLIAHNLAMVGLTEGDSTRRVFADIVSSNYFSTLGVALFRGRSFSPAEEKPGSAIPVAIISYSFWKRMGADPAELGKTLQINGRIYSVVGVAPPGFTGTSALMSPELYLPLGVYELVSNDFDGPVRSIAARDSHQLILVGRLNQGMTSSQADAALALVAQRLAEAYPAENKNQTFFVHPLSRLSVSTSPADDHEATFPFLLLMAMAGVVLLIASFNVAGMMLARGAARRREIGIRMALGASRRNLAQQLFTEALVLALIGGSAGLFLAYLGPTLLLRSMARMLPLDLVFSAAPDWRVAAVTLGFCLLSALVFGLGPARSVSRSVIVADIKEGEARDGAQSRRFSRRGLLVVGQIALSLMLLSAAGLFVRSALVAARIDPGFKLDHEAIVEVDPSLVGYDEAHGRQVYRSLLERLRAVPGVQSASVAATVPFGMISLGRNVKAADAPPSNGRGLSFRANIVGAGYFGTLGIPILRGRDVSEADTAAPSSALVAYLDQNGAERLWPHQDPIGRRIRLDSDDSSRPPLEAEIVGVVGHVQDDVFGNGEEPHVYLPFGPQYQSDMNIHLRVADADAGLLQAVRRTVRSVDERIPILALKSMQTQVDGSMSLWILRTVARLFMVFAAVALLLAMVGLYGLRAYTVARRTREIGIRIALGARPGDAQRMILREGVVLTLSGLAAGLVLSLLAGQVVAGLLYRVRGLDPLVLASAAAVLFAVSLLACYLPALRASRVDPMIALRQE